MFYLKFFQDKIQRYTNTAVRMPTTTTVQKQQSGFTMLELIITLTIFLILTTVMLLDYNGINNRITLDTLAHQVAQWVRQTQVSAMGVRHVQSNAGIFPGYGLHFDRATPDRFTYFADLGSQNKRYDPLAVGANCGDVGEECEQIIMLPRGYQIEKLCSELANIAPVPGPDCSTFSNSNNFDIVFTRPDPDASIYGEYSVGNAASSSRAEIYLVSTKGYRRAVEVWVTGQVSVQ